MSEAQIAASRHTVDQGKDSEDSVRQPRVARRFPVCTRGKALFHVDGPTQHQQHSSVSCSANSKKTGMEALDSNARKKIGKSSTLQLVGNTMSESGVRRLQHEAAVLFHGVSIQLTFERVVCHIAGPALRLTFGILHMV